jgi:hypothetical protein
MPDQSTHRAFLCMQEHNLTVSQIDNLPRPLRGLPAGVPQFLHTCNIIKRAGYARADGHSLRCWGKGLNYEALIKLMQEKEMV